MKPTKLQRNAVSLARKQYAGKLCLREDNLSQVNDAMMDAVASLWNEPWDHVLSAMLSEVM